MEILNVLSLESTLPNQILSLKKGSLVKLLCNVDPGNGHGNGARYVLEIMTNNVLVFWIAIGMHKGSNRNLSKKSCGSRDDSFPVPRFKRIQFPITD